MLKALETYSEVKLLEFHGCIVHSSTEQVDCPRLQQPHHSATASELPSSRIVAIAYARRPAISMHVGPLYESVGPIHRSQVNSVSAHSRCISLPDRVGEGTNRNDSKQSKKHPRAVLHSQMLCSIGKFGIAMYLQPQSSRDLPSGLHFCSPLWSRYC
jgi:hypothetical protein